MNKSRFTDSQIMDAATRAEAGLAVSNRCRKLGIGTVTFYKRRANLSGTDVSMMVRMKALEGENASRRKMSHPYSGWLWPLNIYFLSGGTCEDYLGLRGID